MRTSLPLAFGKLVPLTLGIGKLFAYTLDPIPKMRECIGDSGNNCMSNETNMRKMSRFEKVL